VVAVKSTTGVKLNKWKLTRDVHRAYKSTCQTDSESYQAHVSHYLSWATTQQNSIWFENFPSLPPLLPLLFDNWGVRMCVIGATLMITFCKVTQIYRLYAWWCGNTLHVWHIACVAYCMCGILHVWHNACAAYYIEDILHSWHIAWVAFVCVAYCICGILQAWHVACVAYNMSSIFPLLNCP